MAYKRHFVLAFWVSIVALSVLVAVQFGTALNPVGFTFENVSNVLGININYNIPTTLYPFASSPLEVVNSVTITCTFSTSLLGTSDTGQTTALSVATVDASPTHTLSLASPQSGTKFTSFTVREGIYCPDVTNGAFPPNLVSGNVNLSWTATKKDGTTVTILSDSQPIHPVYTSGTNSGTVLALPSGSNPLVHLSLYSWTVPASQVESALGVNILGDDFTSLQNIAVTNSDTFYQGNVPSTPWTFTNIGPSLLSFTLHEVTGNPIAPNLYQMALNVIDPPGGKFNIQNIQVVTLQGTISNVGTQTINSPEVKLYYTDPSSVTKNTAIADFFIKPDANTGGSTSGTYTYTFKYPFPSNTQVGQYTFQMSLSGNPTVASANVYVSSIAPPVCQTGYYVDPATFTCKSSTVTKTCADGSVIPATSTCPTSGNPSPNPNPNPNPSPGTTCLTNVLTCFSGTNLSQIGSGTIQSAITIGMIGLVLLIIIGAGGAVYHMIDRKNGGSGVAPGVIVNEEE